MSLQRFIYLVLLTLCMMNDAFAKSQHSTMVPNTLRVGVVMDMPFAQNIDGHYSGIAIDIWNNIANSHNWNYTYIPLSPNISQDLNRLSDNGDLDVVIGAISVDSERLQKVDFTRPFFLSSIGVVTRKHEVNMFDVFKNFLSRVLLFSIIILLVSFICFIHLLWYVERSKLEGVSTNYYTALSKDMWRHLFKNGLSMPTTFAGRLLTLIWIVFAAALITSINANYTAAMTVNLGQSNSRINTIDDLREVKIAGVNGKLSMEIIEKHGFAVQKADTFEQAMNLLENSDVDAVVCDVPIGIEYLRTHGTKKYVLSPLIIENDELAFALRLNSPLRYKIDLGITQLQDNDSVIAICRRYIGDEAARCDM